MGEEGKEAVQKEKLGYMNTQCFQELCKYLRS